MVVTIANGDGSRARGDQPSMADDDGPSASRFCLNSCIIQPLNCHAQHQGERATQPSRLGFLLQLLDDGLLDGVGRGCGRPAVENVAVAADEELFKVPLDALEAHDARLLPLHPLVERVRVVAVHFGLAKDGEGDAVVDLAEVLDLVVGAGLLRAELIARESEDGEVVAVACAQVLVQLLEALVLRRQAALRRRIDDKDDLALVLVERILLAAL